MVLGGIAAVVVDVAHSTHSTCSACVEPSLGQRVMTIVRSKTPPGSPVDYGQKSLAEAIQDPVRVSVELVISEWSEILVCNSVSYHRTKLLFEFLLPV